MSFDSANSSDLIENLASVRPVEADFHLILLVSMLKTCKILSSSVLVGVH